MSWNLPYIIREYALLRGNAGPVSTKTISTMLSIKEWISVVLQWLSGCLSNKIKWQSRKPPAGWFSGHRSLRSRLRGAGLRTDFLQYLKTLLLPTCIVPFSSIPPGSKQAGAWEAQHRDNNLSPRVGSTMSKARISNSGSQQNHLALRILVPRHHFQEKLSGASPGNSTLHSMDS